jgi:endonuclease YncB( thermonuclease family)
MSNQIIIGAFIAAASVALLSWASSHDREPFTVVKHHDGDTTTVTDKNGKKISIRYHVIDANELSQAGGKEAKKYLYTLLPISTKINIVFTANQSYGRYVGTVYHRGTNINLEMLKAGHAIIDDRYVKQISKEMQLEYYRAQSDAKKKKVGRWSNRKWCVQTPWEFRESMAKRRKARR